MAYIVLSEQDGIRVRQTLEYIDPGSHELLTACRPHLSDDEWTFVIDYVQRRLRSAMEIEIMARGMAESAAARGLCDRRGAEHFLRSKAWIHNFGIIQTSDEDFAALSAANANRLTRAIDALILIAQDLLFDRIDEEYERLLNPR